MESKNYLDEFSPEALAVVKRRQLLPVWIKICIWIFLVAGAIAVPAFIIGIFGFSFSIAMYGFSTTEPTSMVGIALLLLFVLKGVVSYGLWFEKKWAINLGLFDGYLGIAICIISMIFALGRDVSGFSFRLEIVFLIPYLIKLHRIKRPWMTAS
jgi:hypothetical protein